MDLRKCLVDGDAAGKSIVVIIYRIGFVKSVSKRAKKEKKVKPPF
jgi:hypothetical protein